MSAPKGTPGLQAGEDARFKDEEGRDDQHPDRPVMPADQCHELRFDTVGAMHMPAET